MIEEWRPVFGYEGIYEVSSLGQIKRVKPVKGGGVGMVQSTMNKALGYLTVRLYDGTGQEGRKTLYVHRLVATSFIGPCPLGMVVNHKDFDRSNNRPDNLEYVTQHGNVHHSVKAGRFHRGEKSYIAKLTDDQVSAMRSMRPGTPYRAIAAAFGVSYNTAYSAINGQTWKHL